MKVDTRVHRGGHRRIVPSNSEGKCYAWDDRATCYGRGQGVATIVLKRLDAALKDVDFVHAAIRHLGSGQDGKNSSAYMEAQLKLIKECYNRASLDVTETGYVEAHMTGIPTGDLIEVEALARTFGKSRKADDPVIVGSVKINFGCTEPVIAAIIKTTFILRHGLIPPNLNYKNTTQRSPSRIGNYSLALSTQFLQLLLRGLTYLLIQVPTVFTP